MKTLILMILFVTGCVSVQPTRVEVYYQAKEKRVVGSKCEGERPCFVKVTEVE